MKEYIEKSALLEMMSRNSITEKITFADGKNIVETVRELPAADVVEVIRCKNCRHSTTVSGVIGEALHCCYWCRDTYEDGYCHEGC